ncbi:hypothetical protein D3P08_13140 [Paenibacillus nanensis]|uniref:Uncharacterized protein n=1 Tax=Paenibacillus nanensis TaxID=393251 RepID=A0A3A1UW50_9BACL|nr:hypothetical protein [Paenibacillus nanensis]RIX52415.1 hypothetical protein D3P08_13140 [Paenibacillus nanensis]
MTKEPDKKPNTFIFQVEIMVEERHHTTALEKLIKEMNRCEWTDYRIVSGMQLGRIIEERIEKSSSKIKFPLSDEKPAKPATPPNNAMESAGVEQIRGFIKKNSLIRLIVNKGFGNTINIPCRIINMDEKEQIVTVYHVDEKQVYTFRLNEIEDFIV